MNESFKRVKSPHPLTVAEKKQRKDEPKKPTGCVDCQKKMKVSPIILPRC